VEILVLSKGKWKSNNHTSQHPRIQN
jgi:hypothetical protein